MQGLTNRSWIFYFEEHETEDAEDAEENVEIPEDLTSTPDPELETMEGELLATFDAIRTGTEQLNQDNIGELETIKLAVQRVRAEVKRRASERQELAARAEALAAELVADENSETAEVAAEAATATAVVETADVVIPDAVTPPPAQAVVASAPAAPLVIRRPRLNVPLSEVRRRAPDPELGGRGTAMVLVAPDVPSFSAGRPLDTLDRLTEAVHRRAKALGNPSGPATVATIRKEYDIVLDREAAPEKIWDIMKRAADPVNLVAAGGWCAPSTIIYDFFNIACDDGILDAPTVGIERGGIRFPTSPSISDALSNIWLWTETDDQSAATGGGQKPCVRVPCPTFLEERLDCHGLCITAGNLTESAYPEVIRNYLRLVMSAHRHVINQRIIADIVSQSVAVSIPATGATNPISSGLLGAIDLQVADYREKYRMCDTDVLEVVLPRWVTHAIRSDLARRNGTENYLAVTDAEIRAYFDVRQVRVQFVTDWQVGSAGLPGFTSPLTAWPASVQFLIMAAGTFVVGNGLDLELGVVRDSVLNAKNDHTAAWTEECKLVAKIGHESRVVTVPFCVNGLTGAASLAGCAGLV